MAAEPRVFIFHGPDQFSAREAVLALRERLGAAPANVVRLDDKVSLIDIATAAHTATFFAEPRLVVIEGLAGRFGGRRRGTARRSRGRTASSLEPSELDRLVEVMTTLPETSTVVMLEGNPPGVFLDAFRGIANMTAFPVKRGAELRRWTEARLRSRGATASDAALERLTSMVDGNHLGELAQEIDKLIAYTDGRRIELADIEEVGSDAVTMQVWDLTDAVVAGQVRTALSVLQRMDEKSQPPQLLMSMIVRQFRHVIVAQAMLREGYAAPQIGEMLAISQYPLEKAIGQATRYPAQQLENAYRRLLEADAAVKTGVMDIDTALEALIVDLGEIAAAGRRRGAAPARG